MPISVTDVLAQVRAEHHTSKYKGDALVVRRGLAVRLETESTVLRVQLARAHPKNPGALAAEFSVSQSAPHGGWKLQKSEHNGHFELHIPITATVGLYQVSDTDSTLDMFVLFNPFLPDDQVHLAGAAEREEYVLNDQGRIWVGSHKRPGSIPWNYSQFRDGIVRTCFSLLDQMPVDDRDDAAKVVRHLSAAVNVQDENGVIVGRWDGDYAEGTSPTAWTGSAAVLNQFVESGKPVRYGQCWVFAGVLTTVMRALGIPARTITNFVSAHDSTKPYNRSVDKYFDSSGTPIEDKSADSVWNFHVWSSAWMKRPDLQDAAKQHGMDFGGWQAVDATPQETSSDLYQMGPSSVVAVKHGFTLNYDTDFVIGEVNADVLHYWAVEGSDEFAVRSKYERHIGQKISTKALGSERRSDVTLEYKFAEGSEEERASLLRRPSAATAPAEEDKDVDFTVDCPPSVNVGNPIVFTIRATSGSEKEARVNFNVLYRATDYTGMPKARIGKVERIVTLRGGSAEFSIEVPAEQYEPYLAQGVTTIQFISSAKVTETGQTWSFESVTVVDANEVLVLSAPKRMTLGGAATVTAHIKNTSSLKLTNVVLRAEGEDLTALQAIKLEAIEAGQVAKAQFTINATDEGNKLLIATLDTAELKDISATARIQVMAGRFRTHCVVA